MLLSRMMNDFTPLMRLQNEVNRAFEGFFDDLPAARSYAATYPAINVWEDSDGNTAYVEAELPGLRNEDLDVSVMGSQVTISGERRIGSLTQDEQPQGQPEISWHRRERGQGRFSRTLTLPWDIDPDKVEARLSNGVLTVTLPKSEAARPKKVKLLT